MNAGDVSNEFSVQFSYPCQGVLLKRSGNSLNKEWKKKYVTLSNDGILTYHSSVNVSWRVSTVLRSMRLLKAWLMFDGSRWCRPWQEYMLNAPGKEMDLLRVTVKVPGKRPPRAVPTCGPPAGLNGRVKDVLGPEGKDWHATRRDVETPHTASLIYGGPVGQNTSANRSMKKNFKDHNDNWKSKINN